MRLINNVLDLKTCFSVKKKNLAYRTLVLEYLYLTQESKKTNKKDKTYIKKVRTNVESKGLDAMIVTMNSSLKYIIFDRMTRLQRQLIQLFNAGGKVDKTFP